jgi:hypothetical protein
LGSLKRRQTHFTVKDVDNPTTEGIHQNGGLALVGIREQKLFDADILHLTAGKAQQRWNHRDAGDMAEVFGDGEEVANT